MATGEREVPESVACSNGSGKRDTGLRYGQGARGVEARPGSGRQLGKGARSRLTPQGVKPRRAERGGAA